jgi:hypothetical protein
MGRTASTEPQCLYKGAIYTLDPLTQVTPYTAAGRDPTGPHTVANAGKHNTQEKNKQVQTCTRRSSLLYVGVITGVWPVLLTNII